MKRVLFSFCLGFICLESFSLFAAGKKPPEKAETGGDCMYWQNLFFDDARPGSFNHRMFQNFHDGDTTSVLVPEDMKKKLQLLSCTRVWMRTPPKGMTDKEALKRAQRLAEELEKSRNIKPKAIPIPVSER